jgi:tetratricopeptide (TPR) repeat protein
MTHSTTPIDLRSVALALTLGALVAGCSVESPDAIWEGAKKAFQERDFPRAEAAMAKLDKLRAPTTEDSMMRAQIAIAKNDVSGALEKLALVPDDHPMAASARLEEGQLELRRHRASRAAKAFREAIRLDPKLIPAHRELIYILGMQLRRTELAEEFRQLSELQPLNFDQVFVWCLTRRSVWEPIEITGEMAKYVAADPEDRESRLALADGLRKLNRLDEADEALKPLSNDDPEARTARVQLALDRGDMTEAEELLAGGPRKNLGLDLLRGRLAMARGNTAGAVAAYRDAVAAEANNRDAVFGLAHSLQRLGDPEAKRYLEDSLRLERLETLVQRAVLSSSKKNIPLIRDLGAACAEVGRYPEARAWYQIAIAADPLDAEAQQALFKLKDAKPPTS